MAVSVTLRQEKTILTGDYRVVATITAALPAGMFPLFVLKEGIDAYDEVYSKVADLDDLANYVENPLTVLDAASAGEFASVTPGDTLTITNASTQVPEWFDTYFTTAVFTVAEVDVGGDWIKVQSVKPFPTATTGLNWSITGGWSGTGTAAKTRREDTTKDTYLRRHVTMLLGSVKAAEARVEAIKAGVSSVVDAANTFGTTFEGVETDTYP